MGGFLSGIASGLSSGSVGNTGGVGGGWGSLVGQVGRQGLSSGGSVNPPSNSMAGQTISPAHTGQPKSATPQGFYALMQPPVQYRPYENPYMRYFQGR